MYRTVQSKYYCSVMGGYTPIQSLYYVHVQIVSFTNIEMLTKVYS